MRHASHPSCAPNHNHLPIHRSGGLWRACYTQGETPRWEKYARALPGVRSMNKAGQSYNAPNGLVENYGEILGRAVHFTASGAFTEVALRMFSIHWKNAPSRPERTAAHRPTLRWTGPHAALKTSTSRSRRAASSSSVSRSSAPPSRARVRGACFDYGRQIEQQQQDRDARPCTLPTGALRVLYADEDIRIFTNRADSPDRWESEGLVVVQVRDELFA